MTEARAGNVIEALCRVARDLPAIGRDQTASAQQGGYAYRGIEQITKHVQSLFAEHGVVFTPHVRSYEVRDLVINGKPWTDIYEMVEYTVYGPGGVEDRITVGPILAVGRDNSDKGGNKCLTQAYKYALIQALTISDAKDDADGATHEADAGRLAPPVEVPAQLAAILKAVEDAPDDGLLVAIRQAVWNGDPINLVELPEGWWPHVEKMIAKARAGASAGATSSPAQAGEVGVPATDPAAPAAPADSSDDVTPAVDVDPNGPADPVIVERLVGRVSALPDAHKVALLGTLDVEGIDLDALTVQDALELRSHLDGIEADLAGPVGRAREIARKAAS